jgi:L-fuconolactonase
MEARPASASVWQRRARDEGLEPNDSRAAALRPNIGRQGSENSAPRPERELEAFARVELCPGETRRVTLTLEACALDARAFADFDIASRRFERKPRNWHRARPFAGRRTEPRRSRAGSADRARRRGLAGTSSPWLAGDRLMTPRIDTHQHFWTYRPEHYAWIGGDMGVLRRDYTPAELEPQLRAAHIDGTLAVEARGHVDETENLLAIADRTPFVRGVVGWLPLTDPEVETLLEGYAKHPKLKGLRHWMGAEGDLHYMTSDELHRGVALLELFQLSYDLMLWPPQLAAVPAFVDRHPNQIFILDHFAKPYIRERRLEPWRKQLSELARRPNVYCKLSGLTTEADHERWTVHDLQPYFQAALEAFKPGRLMFGSDWPVCTLSTSYGRWVETVETLVAPLSEVERVRILGGTAVEAYRL